MNLVSFHTYFFSLSLPFLFQASEMAARCVHLLLQLFPRLRQQLVASYNLGMQSLETTSENKADQKKNLKNLKRGEIFSKDFFIYWFFYIFLYIKKLE